MDATFSFAAGADPHLRGPDEGLAGGASIDETVDVLLRVNAGSAVLLYG